MLVRVELGKWKENILTYVSDSVLNGPSLVGLMKEGNDWVGHVGRSVIRTFIDELIGKLQNN